MDTPRTAFTLSADVNRAHDLGLPIVALESTVITHGLPRPDNLSLARDMEQAVRREGAIPATVAVLDGQVRVGLSFAELERLAEMAGGEATLKISRRDLAKAITRSASGGTTVAGTMFVAHHAGIRVFATGGIGGVHKEARFDVSTDLQALADTPMIIVCAGAKSILDLPATIEYLETMSVPVIGFKTDKFPAFYSVSLEPALPVGLSVDSVEEIIEFAQAHWGLGMKSSVLVSQPLPPDLALPGEEVEKILEQVSREVREKGIRGQRVTPFELSRVNELTHGRALRANLALLLNNATLAAQIARGLASSHRQKIV
jgi:pseudouridine-5'-phosphate glycosidase